ncbi:MAG: PQQ-dependent sugar dehydrogenase [Chloroflexi bacterium]|nr:PQQ-dependent sugar dehydrogenase [Chloroflexota bacterium]
MFSFAIADVVGVSLMLFGLAWGGYGLICFIRNRKMWLTSGLIMLAAGIGMAVYVYLLASTTARRAFINLEVRALVSSLLVNAAAAVLAGVLFVVILRIAHQRRRHSPLQYTGIILGGMALYMAAGMVWLHETTFEPDLDEVFTEVETVENVFVDEGVPIKVFENATVKAPTALEMGPDGALYVAGAGGFIWRMVDGNLDGVADSVTEFAAGLQQPHGLAWGDEGLFVNEEGQLSLLLDTDGDHVYDEKKVILGGFPGEQYAFHQNNGLTFGPDGRLYIGSGSTTDHRPETHPLAARILSINPDGSDLKVYATGVRNPFGLIPAPDGGFFAVDNGSSGCIDTATKIDDCSSKIDVPEEVNYILEGRDYGFPTYFGMPPADSDTMPPVVTFPQHSAPTGIVIYDGDSFPAKMKGQLFVSLWARGEIYRVQLYRLDEEHYIGAPILFANNLVGISALLNAPDGGLYAASYNGNAIYHFG